MTIGLLVIIVLGVGYLYFSYRVLKDLVTEENHIDRDIQDMVAFAWIIKIVILVVLAIYKINWGYEIF